MRAAPKPAPRRYWAESTPTGIRPALAMGRRRGFCVLLSSRSTMTLPLPSFRSRIVPVVVITDPKQAAPLADALLEGGIDVIEITLRHPAALAAIEAAARHAPALCVGA